MQPEYIKMFHVKQVYHVRATSFDSEGVLTYFIEDEYGHLEGYSECLVEITFQTLVEVEKWEETTHFCRCGNVGYSFIDNCYYCVGCFVEQYHGTFTHTRKGTYNDAYTRLA